VGSASEKIPARGSAYRDDRKGQMTETKQPNSSRRKRRTSAINWVVPLGCGLLFLFLLKFIFFIGYVPSDSMEPTIQKGSIIIGIRVMGELRRGDIVVFRHDGQLLIKRIAAIPEDRATVNGETLTVPDGCYYMLGDNSADSIDSRYWVNPFVQAGEIVAKI